MIYKFTETEINIILESLLLTRDEMLACEEDPSSEYIFTSGALETTEEAIQIIRAVAEQKLKEELDELDKELEELVQDELGC